MPRHGVAKLQTDAAAPPPPSPALVSAVYEGPLESPPWHTAASLLRDALGATHITLTLRPRPATEMAPTVTCGPATASSARLYATRFSASDPFVDLPGGTVTTAEEMIGPEWFKSAVYRGYFRPLGIRHLLGADIFPGDGIECRLRATRGTQAAPFSATDKQLVQMLVPHLERALRLRARLDSLARDRSLFAGAVAKLQVGVVLLDGRATVIGSNDEARRILDTNDGLRQTGHALLVESYRESRDLARMVRTALACALEHKSHTAEALAITRPSGRSKFGVVVRAIPPGIWSESRQRPMIALYLRDPEAAHLQSDAQEIVGQIFGFTRMESLLAVRLANGLTLDEAAANLGVSRNTARTHLRAIYWKTGVGHQTALVRLVLNSVVKLG